MFVISRLSRLKLLVSRRLHCEIINLFIVFWHENANKWFELCNNFVSLSNRKSDDNKICCVDLDFHSFWLAFHDIFWFDYCHSVAQRCFTQRFDISFFNAIWIKVLLAIWNALLFKFGAFSLLWQGFDGLFQPIRLPKLQALAQVVMKLLLMECAKAAVT